MIKLMSMTKSDSESDRRIGHASVPAFKAAPRRRTGRMIKRLLLTIIILGLAGTAGFLGYKYHQSQKEVTSLSDPKVAATKQVNDLVTKVGKLVQLPTGETPTIATVTDLSKLKGQTFFANAKNNDQVLIYTQAKRAVLYRPSDNKVLEIAPLSIGNTAGTTPIATPAANTSTDSTTPAQ
jgi:hypothetical protein